MQEDLISDLIKALFDTKNVLVPNTGETGASIQPSMLLSMEESSNAAEKYWCIEMS